MAVNVFLSFSGEASEAIAIALHEWLPSVIQSVDPFLSAKNIDSGSRWSPEIAGKLEDCGFGILCLTPANLDSPWILFEAGALGKLVDQSRVVPYLVGVDRVSVRQPLAQFQSELANSADTLKLLKSINRISTTPISDERLTTTFERWWPDLEKKLEDAKRLFKTTPPSESEPQPDNMSVLAKSVGELIQTVQGLHNTMGRPERLLPVEYLSFALDRIRSESRFDDLGRLEEVYDKLIRLHEQVRELRQAIEEDLPKDRVDAIAKSIHTRLSILRDRVRRSLRRGGHISASGLKSDSQVILDLTSKD